MKNKAGICSWSLRNDVEEVAYAMKETGLSRLHLDISAVEGFQEPIAQNNWTVGCTMLAFPQEDYSSIASIRETGGIMPDSCWEHNRELALDAIGKTATMGVPYLSTHVGFIDHEDAEGYATFCARLTELADAAQAVGIMLLMETGQESATELLSCLEDLNHPALGVNFDPGNMILYGMGDPVKAVTILAPWIRHVHIKDAIKSPVPGEWGTEVPWGDGEVDCKGFFRTLEEIGYTGVLAIEREAGDARRSDICQAAERMACA